MANYDEATTAEMAKRARAMKEQLRLKQKGKGPKLEVFGVSSDRSERDMNISKEIIDPLDEFDISGMHVPHNTMSHERPLTGYSNSPLTPMDINRGPMDINRGPMDINRGPMDINRGPMDNRGPYNHGMHMGGHPIPPNVHMFPGHQVPHIYQNPSMLYTGPTIVPPPVDPRYRFIRKKGVSFTSTRPPPPKSNNINKSINEDLYKNNKNGLKSLQLWISGLEGDVQNKEIYKKSLTRELNTVQAKADNESIIEDNTEMKSMFEILQKFHKMLILVYGEENKNLNLELISKLDSSIMNLDINKTILNLTRVENYDDIKSSTTWNKIVKISEISSSKINCIDEYGRLNQIKLDGFEETRLNEKPQYSDNEDSDISNCD